MVVSFLSCCMSQSPPDSEFFIDCAWALCLKLKGMQYNNIIGAHSFYKHTNKHGVEMFMLLTADGRRVYHIDGDKAVRTSPEYEAIVTTNDYQFRYQDQWLHVQPCTAEFQRLKLLLEYIERDNPEHPANKGTVLQEDSGSEDDEDEVDSTESVSDCDTDEYTEGWIDRLIRADATVDEMDAAEPEPPVDLDSVEGIAAFNAKLDEELREMGVDPSRCTRKSFEQNDDIIVVEEEIDGVCVRSYVSRKRGNLRIAAQILSNWTREQVFKPLMRFPQ